MSEKKIMVANLDTDAPIDLLLKDQGEWIRTDSGFNYTVNPSPIFNVSVETPLLPIAIGAPAIPVVYDITVTPKSLAISSEDKLILNSLPGNVYEDHITTLTTGLTFQEALDVGLDNFTDTLGVEFVYNFLDTEYENLLAPVSDHNVIPNINVVMSETESVFTEEENLLNSTTANMLEDNLEVSNTFGGLSNQIVANNEKAKEYESNKGLFPMYCQINIPSPPGEHIIGDAIGVAQAEHLIARDIHGATDTAPQTVVGDALAYSYMYYDSDG